MELSAIVNNYHYLFALTLFLIGSYTMLTHPNLIKKIIGLNIMETSVFLLFVSTGYVEGGGAPIIHGEAAVGAYVNPVPHALILTGIVIAISITALALSLIIKIYEYYGTLDTDEISRLRR
ncbi:Na(+)/H(+) antiporter subunit C [Natranaerofaba carboxydovora]|nr:cation:proton antiporter subunit C [Natranaerofaba carboxydovora]UMZ72858.1 Na(+)/H(+) antiporter subunit C [Natranaerofaba carboxydovora]